VSCFTGEFLVVIIGTRLQVQDGTGAESLRSSLIHCDNGHYKQQLKSDKFNEDGNCK